MSTDPKKPLGGDGDASGADSSGDSGDSGDSAITMVAGTAAVATLSVPAPASPPPPPQPSGKRLPSFAPPEGERYVIETELARGGLGRVFIARDLLLERRVAIKELITISERATVRFLREVKVSARLQHPGIIPIHDAGRWPDGNPFYTMKLVSGRSFHELVEEVEALDDRLALLPHILAVADAMAYAHSHHIIHRDLKPANIIVGAFGETIVIDWGLAKILSDPTGELEVEPLGFEELEVEAPPPTSPTSELTIMGVVLGTPQFMAPEQARGERLDERADVYAIGAVLFFLLVGKAPHAGTSLDEILAKARTPEVALFDPLPEGVPRDLAAILRKAMAREPAHRYPTARELAEDLRRFLRGQLVSAHEYSGLTLLGRWLARHRISVMVAALLLTVLAGVSVYGVRRILDARNAAEAERRVALARSNELVRAQAENALEHDPTQALAWLKTLPEEAKREKASRDLALEAVSRGVALHVFRQTEGRATQSVASPDGRYLAYTGDGRSLRIRDLRENRTTSELPVAGEVAYQRFSPDGETVAFTEWGRESVWLWEYRTGKLREVLDLGGMINNLVYSRDGKQLLLSGNGPEIRIFDLSSGKTRRFAGHEGIGVDARLTPDGRHLLYAGPAATIHFVDLESGADHLLHGPENTPILTPSPDGKFLAASGLSGTIWLWDLGQMQYRPLRGHTTCPGVLQFSRDGRRLLSASIDHTVRLWDVEHGTMQVLGEHTGGATWAMFSSDENVVASAGKDGLVYLYYLGTGDRRVLRGHTNATLAGQFLDADAYLMTVSLDRTTRVWPIPQDPAKVLRTSAWVRTLAFSPDGLHVAATDLNDLVWYWDTRTGGAVSWRGHTRTIHSIAFSPDGRMLASASLDNTIRLWDTTNGTSRSLSVPLSPAPELVFAPDGRQFAFTGSGGALHLWDLASDQDRLLEGPQKTIRSLVYSPDGRWIAAAGAEVGISVWELATGRQTLFGEHGRAVLQVAFSHSGRWLASGTTDGGVRLRERIDARASDILLGQLTRRIRTIAFSPDDRLVAAAGEDGAILLCQVETRDCHLLAGHVGDVVELAFSPAGHRLASTGIDGTVRLWDVPQGTCLRIQRHDGAISNMEFSPDGRWLASAGSDSTARLWRIDSMPFVPVEPAAFARWLDMITSVVLKGRESATW